MNTETINETTNEEAKEVSLESIKELAKKLKKLDTNWASSVADEMSVAKYDAGVIKATKVYNIVNGQVPNQKYRILFIICATIVYNKLEEKQNKALELAKQSLTDGEEKK